jgi:hypothetical protein
MQNSLVTNVIEDYLTHRLSDERRTGCFHPSAMSQCPRFLYESYLKKTSVTEEGNPTRSRIFDNGKMVHLRIQKYLKEAGVLIDDEVQFYDEEYEICGSADGIIKFHDSFGVLEIKSINNNGFNSLSAPKFDHAEQLNIYMFCLSRLGYVSGHGPVSGKNLKWGIIVYENKNNQQIKEYLLSMDHKIIDPVLEKLNYVKDHLQRGVRPPKVVNDGCRWCDIKLDCY